MNFEQIDYDSKANFVIERVFSDARSIDSAAGIGGDEKVTTALLHAKYFNLFT